MTSEQLQAAIDRIRKILTYANGEYAADLHRDLDVGVATDG